MTDETTPKLTLWQQFLAACQSPLTALKNKSKESPIVTIIAIAFLAQPVFSTGVTIVQGIVSVRQQFDPNQRPVTKGELDLVNQKIDFVQKLIEQDMANDQSIKPVVVTVPYHQLQNQLTTVQKKLDTKYEASKK